jgi:regulator of protease activity HflC (stomatin/prohibitin superfamily)
MIGLSSVAMMVAFVAGLIYYVFKPIYIVREGESIVIERMGIFNRVLSPGLHFIWWPYETPRRVKWTYTVESRTPSGQTVQKSGVFEDFRIRVAETLYEMIPVACLTEDNRSVHVNLTVSYSIENLQLATTRIDDLYAQLESDLETTLTGIVRSLTSTQLKNTDIEKRMRSGIGELGWVKKYGVVLEKCRLQNITFPKEMQDLTMKFIATEMETQAAMNNTQAEYDRKMAKLEFEEKLIRRNQQIAALTMEHELAQKEKECVMECKRRELLHMEQLAEEAKELELLTSVQQSEEFKVAFLQSRNWAKLVGGNCQKMIVPAHFTSFLGGQDLLPQAK